jgi:YVTN family beta-propeller protein
MTKTKIGRTSLAVAALSLLLAGPAFAAPAYHLLQSITLGGEGGWDYINRDPATGNLFIARGTHVMVADPHSGKVLADIGGLMGIHGTAFVGGHAYVTEGGANRLAVVDTATLKKTGEIAVGMRPDAVIYDSASGHLFTFNSISKDTTAVDPVSGKAVGSVALGGKPESAVSDGAGTIFVNIEDTSEMVAFDAVKLTVKARYSLAPCKEPSGIAADLAHGRIFSGCDNKLIAVTDMKSGKVVTTIPIGEGVDANRFDPQSRLVFSSNGESGDLTVAQEISPDKYRVLQNLVTARGARTMELDPQSHKIFLITADRAVPGSFRLMVAGR